MWRQILSPVVFVILTWVTMSGATTYYMFWLEQSYQRDFSENVSSIRAANRFERVLWKILSAWPIDASEFQSFREHWLKSKGMLTKEQLALRETSNHALEVEEIRKLDQQIAQFELFMDHELPTVGEENALDLKSLRLRASQLADTMTATSNKLRLINQQLLDEESIRRGKIRPLVFVARISLLILGPLLGILLGWRISQQLHRSVAKIGVTLNKSNSGNQSELGTLSLTPTGNLAQVQQQAEQVITRLQEAYSELQEARAEAIRAERLAAVGELAAGVAHEIRNPLTSVKLLLQYANRVSPPQNLTENQWELVLEEVERMETTIQGLLDFARPHDFKRRRLDFHGILQRALNLVQGKAQQGNIQILSPQTRSPLWMIGDTELLHQMCVNLLFNAIEAMPQGGEISVQSTLQEDGWLKIQFQDSGPGLHDAVLPRLFEPFSTTKDHGTGLGLAICRRIVLEHGGTIFAENPPSGGARFIVKLPSNCFSTVSTLDSETEETNGNIVGN